MCVVLVLFRVLKNAGVWKQTSDFYLLTRAQLSGGVPDTTLISKLNRCIQLIRERLLRAVELL